MSLQVLMCGMVYLGFPWINVVVVAPPGLVLNSSMWQPNSFLVLS